MAWANWSGSVACEPWRLAAPADEAEVARLVAEAAAGGREVRVVGTGHSFTPLCATDGLLLSLDALQGVAQADATFATVLAGSKISALGAPLQAAGLALTNQGDVDVQSIGGALGTGTHGTGRTLANMSAAVVGLRVVGEGGAMVDIDDAELLRAARVSMGMFGVIVAARLRAMPAYRLHEHCWELAVDQAFAELPELIARHRHCEFFWRPGADACDMKTLHPTAAVATDRPGERIDWSWRIFPSVRARKFNEMEYAVPAAAGPDCFFALRRLMRQRHPDVAWPIEYRTLAPDDAMLSPAQFRPSVTLSIHQAAELPHEAFFRDAEAIFRAAGGRPHWGKVHYLTARDLAALYPDYDRFRALRRAFDPKGRFMNGYLRTLFPV